MNPCTRTRSDRLRTYALFVVLPAASLDARASTTGEVPAQNGSTWVLHTPHNNLADGYDPHRDPEKDLASAREEAQRSKRNILIVVGGKWCGWCYTMDRFFHDHTDLETLRDKNYVYLKVNMSQENGNRAFLPQFPRIPGYPHIFVLADNGTLIRSQSSDELEDGKGLQPAAVQAVLGAFCTEDQPMSTVPGFPMNTVSVIISLPE
jgi:thioredoxin family protein